MPEPLSNGESRLWDAMFGDVKFLVLQYKLRNQWTDKETAEKAIVQLLQYHGKAGSEYWSFIRTLRLMSAFGNVLKSNPPDDVRKLVKRTDRHIFQRNYQTYLARYWNFQFISKRQQAKKAGNTPYKAWNWNATREALKELADERPNTFRHVLAYYKDQYGKLAPLKPPSLTRLLRYMNDIEFDMEVMS